MTIKILRGIGHLESVPQTSGSLDENCVVAPCDVNGDPVNRRAETGVVSAIATVSL